MECSLIWRRASYSGDQGGNCVEVADMADGTAVRDSKDPDGPVLTVSPAQWATFVGAVSRAELG